MRVLGPRRQKNLGSAEAINELNFWRTAGIDFGSMCQNGPNNPLTAVTLTTAVAGDICPEGLGRAGHRVQ
jgi:hypothetical protein